MENIYLQRIFFYRMNSLISYINIKTGKIQKIHNKDKLKIYSDENFS